MIFFFFGLNLLTQGMKECILHYILYDTFFFSIFYSLCWDQKYIYVLFWFFFFFHIIKNMMVSWVLLKSFKYI